MERRHETQTDIMILISGLRFQISYNARRYRDYLCDLYNPNLPNYLIEHRVLNANYYKALHWRKIQELQIILGKWKEGGILTGR